jgi:hypothetical protein
VVVITSATAKRPVLPLFFLLALPFCGGSSSKDGAGTTTTGSYALQASASLPAAVREKIVNTPAGINSSGMPGEPSVGDDGSASYTLPIWTPDGINGLKPELSIRYNGEQGQGILGPHWQLTGLSTITRCPKTRASDGVQTAVDFFGDTFCLDGQRMFVVGTIDSTHTEFRTERDSFAKIVGTKDTTINQYNSFTVYAEDGLIRYYGTTSFTRPGRGRRPREAAPEFTEGTYSAQKTPLNLPFRRLSLAGGSA